MRHLTMFIKHSVFTVLLLLVISSCAQTNESRVSDQLEIHFVDVGYGDAVLLVQGNDTLFIDGGYPPMTEKVLKYFENIGLTHIDALVITHPHPDHIGVAYGILEKDFPVTTVYSSYPLEHFEIPYGFRKLIENRLSNGSIKYVVLTDGDYILLPEGKRLEVIHPEILVEDMNDSSLVLYLSAFENGVLLTGDIGPQAQERLLREHPDVFPVSLLKAPHHGGRSSEAFYATANPELTVITDGVNPYGNPRTETLELIERYSDSFVRLSQTGHLIVREVPECKSLDFDKKIQINKSK